jgi:hypothetical protein
MVTTRLDGTATDKRIIIAGSRGITDFKMLDDTLSDLFTNKLKLTPENVTVVSGTARGVDRLGEDFAKKYGCVLMRMPAQWDKYGRSAGYRRNRDMAMIADIACIFWNGKSPGTGHMIQLAKDYELDTYVFNEKGELI